MISLLSVSARCNLVSAHFSHFFYIKGVLAFFKLLKISKEQLRFDKHFAVPFPTYMPLYWPPLHQNLRLCTPDCGWYFTKNGRNISFFFVCFLSNLFSASFSEEDCAHAQRKSMTTKVVFWNVAERGKREFLQRVRVIAFQKSSFSDLCRKRFLLFLISSELVRMRIVKATPLDRC